ncbi:MAG: DUF4118 domain-containing protein [Ignavibacteriales bacterium]|nr:DUF4118 domain-containing protein [Ignavibacteriales bacterium]
MKIKSARMILKKIFVFQSSLNQYLISLLIIAVLNVICYTIQTHIGYQTVSFIFLLTISLLPLFNFGPGPIFFAATLSAFSWNYFFIPPQFTLDISKIEDVLMLIMFFIVAMVTGVLSARIRKQEKFVRQREERTNALYKLSKELSAAYNLDKVAEIAIQNISNAFNIDVAILLCGTDKELSRSEHKLSFFKINATDWQIAHWVFTNRQPAGKYTKTLPSSEITHMPLFSVNKSLGVLEIKSINPLSSDQQILLNAFIAQISNAVEKEYLNEESKKSLIISESEKLYKTLFDSISHELKTPLTTIIGATSSFKDEKIRQNKTILSRLINEINIAAERLNRLVENLLDMTRLESGQMKLKLDWNEITDLIESVLKRLSNELINHTVKTDIQENIPLFKFDFGLLEQALINVMHNSLIYTPEKSTIKISVKEEKNICLIEISDNGPGFVEETLSKLFEKFYRIPGTKTGGTGLGLSIAKGFIEAHSGSITAKNRKEGGAVFIIKIPMQN